METHSRWVDAHFPEEHAGSLCPPLLLPQGRGCLMAGLGAGAGLSARRVARPWGRGAGLLGGSASRRARPARRGAVSSEGAGGGPRSHPLCHPPQLRLTCLCVSFLTGSKLGGKEGGVFVGSIPSIYLSIPDNSAFAEAVEPVAAGKGQGVGPCGWRGEGGWDRGWGGCVLVGASCP